MGPRITLVLDLDYIEELRLSQTVLQLDSQNLEMEQGQSEAFPVRPGFRSAAYLQTAECALPAIRLQEICASIPAAYLQIFAWL